MRLLVIGEVDVTDATRKMTRNNALDKILTSYLEVFDQVLYFGPSAFDFDLEVFDRPGLYMCSTSAYSKKLTARLKFLAFCNVGLCLDNIISLFKPDHIQVRLPSLFALKCAFYLQQRREVGVSAYLAGNWLESLQANHPLLALSVGRVMEATQNRLLSKMPVVVTGDRLREQLSYLGAVYPFYSTTHQTIYRRSTRSRTILVVGRLEKIKRVELAIETLRLINQDLSEPFHLLLLGDGPERSTLEAVAKGARQQDFVDFYGHVGDDLRLRNIFLDAKYLIHPSSTEGTSKVLTEALAHGVLPIAVSGVGSNDYILRDGRGALVKPCAEAFAKVIKFYESNEREYSATVEAGYRYAENHTLQKEAEKMWRWLGIVP